MTTLQSTTAPLQNEGVIPAGLTTEKLGQIYAVSQAQSSQHHVLCATPLRLNICTKGFSNKFLAISGIFEAGHQARPKSRVRSSTKHLGRRQEAKGLLDGAAAASTATSTESATTFRRARRSQWRQQ